MKLYSYWRSSCSWRVRIGLHWKGQRYEYVAIHLLRDGGEQKADPYTALNAMQSVPLLEVEDGGQVRRLAQSMAILEYLDERWPDPPLLPADRFIRAQVRQAAEIVNSGIQPYQNSSVQRYVKHELHGDEKAWTRRFLAHGLTALEVLLRTTSGKYAVGDQVTLADLYLVPQLYGARRVELNLSPFPTLTRVEAACNALPAFQAAHPDRQPDAER
ncbi:MAG TPA: maleylacetoacetate isomerase [Myxococcaceae bacterium]|nr:maleylacetoacetate isomerase [Myxococcaceae bacterium]